MISDNQQIIYSVAKMLKERYGLQITPKTMSAKPPIPLKHVLQLDETSLRQLKNVTIPMVASPAESKRSINPIF